MQRALRALIAGSGMSKEAFAKQAGVGRATIYRIMGSQPYAPSPDVLERLVGTASLSVLEFFTRLEEGSSFEGLQPTLPPQAPDEDEAQFADRLSKACLDAATRSRRAQTRALLEDLAVAFGMTDPEQGDRAIDAIRARREA